MQAEQQRSLFWEGDGFSTVGMVLALLITLALVFTCAQVYEVQTASARVQETADAAALAAENMVGEFYIVVTVCDALTFTLSLAMVVTHGIGVVCACIPATSALSKTMLDASAKIKDARNSFYDSATASLERLQAALPFIATAKAQEVLSANSSDSARYQGLVVLAPWQGEDFSSETYDAGDEALSDVQAEHDSLSEAAAEAEQAAQEANEWKQLAYEHDSGSRDEYCMYERAASLAGMEGAENPYFSTVDTWNFADALERAKVYYSYRYQVEQPTGTSAEARGDSALRKRFYAYAIEQVSAGYVNETQDSFDANFPRLPKNTTEMMATSLYTEKVYPVTINMEGKRVMHAWSGCPQVAQSSVVATESIEQMNGAAYSTCPSCEFSVSSMGKVAAASSSISNGFEYHYNIVADAAEHYEKARDVQDPISQKVKGLAEGLFDALGSALSEVTAKRIEMYPPGYLGAVALVVDTASPTSHFSSSFVDSDGAGDLGVRAAVSAAVLVRESSDEGENVLTSFLDGVSAEGAGVAGAAQAVLDVWSGLLGVYAQGQEALESAIESTLGSIPLVSNSGLGTWASQAFSDVIADAGYEAPDLRARKAVLVNSEYVLEEDNSAVSAKLLSIKRAAAESGGSLNGALSSVESQAQDAIDSLGSEFTLATISLFNGAVEIPLTIALPAPATGALSGVVQAGIDALRSVTASITGVRQWR